MAIGIVFWYLSYGMFIDDGESSISVLVVHQVFFVGSITVLNLIYLLGNRQRKPLLIQRERLINRRVGSRSNPPLFSQPRIIIVS